jgi:hypothetical protein
MWKWKCDVRIEIDAEERIRSWLEAQGKGESEKQETKGCNIKQIKAKERG